MSELVSSRGVRGLAGGQWGQLTYPRLEVVGAPPTQLWTVSVVNFYLCLFLNVILGLSPKNSRKIREVVVLGRGYLGPRETFTPAPNFKVVPAPLTVHDHSDLIMRSKCQGRRREVLIGETDSDTQTYLPQNFVSPGFRLNFGKFWKM